MSDAAFKKYRINLAAVILCWAVPASSLYACFTLACPEWDFSLQASNFGWEGEETVFWLDQAVWLWLLAARVFVGVKTEVFLPDFGV